MVRLCPFVTRTLSVANGMMPFATVPLRGKHVVNQNQTTLTQYSLISITHEKTNYLCLRLLRLGHKLTRTDRHYKSCLLYTSGIVFSFRYGIDVMKGMGMEVDKIHAGQANMFLSPLFRDTLAGVTGAVIELYETDGSVGAAKGAGIGAGIYKDNREAFASLERLKVIEPDTALTPVYEEAYQRWLGVLRSM